MDKTRQEKLTQIVAEAQRARAQREQSYREQALKMYPHICGRCGREFSGVALRELTVHHRDHNHDNNPPDGSNWELLCIYCHDNEHQRQLDAQRKLSTSSTSIKQDQGGFQPFANLKELMSKKD